MASTVYVTDTFLSEPERFTLRVLQFRARQLASLAGYFPSSPGARSNAKFCSVIVRTLRKSRQL